MIYTISAFIGVQYSVNLQNARCNNKDAFPCLYYDIFWIILTVLPIDLFISLLLKLFFIIKYLLYYTIKYYFIT
jgi:hypothetical protein